MAFSRRDFLAGAATGAATLVLTACTPTRPTPAPTPSQTAATLPPSPVPAPIELLRSSWAADEFARGSHSFVTAGGSPALRATLRQPLGARVYFAGEATSDDAPGTVEGAWESGIRAAAEVAAVAAPNERVAVIGAGFAGAAAASRLNDYGLEVTVIEARDRVGGRVDTRVTDSWPVPVELGAGWAPRDGSAISDRLAALDISRRSIAEEIRYISSVPAETTFSDRGQRAVIDAVTWAQQQSRDSSIESALGESGAGDLDAAGDPPTPADWLSTELRRNIGIARGASPSTLSSWYGTAQSPAPDTERVTGRYDTVVSSALADLKVWLATAVTSISYSDSGVSIRLITGESLNVDRVVVTVPLGVLKGQGITFQPALPFDYRTAVSDLGFGVVDTVWVRFDEAFWMSDAARWAVVGSDLPITDWLNLEPSTGDPVLVGMVAGDRASALAQLDETGVAAAVRTSLEPFAELAASADSQQ
jgi:monoamine oxidase